MDKKFFHYLYTKNTVPDILDGYCAPMLKAANPLLRMKAKRLLKYWGLLTDKAFFDKRIQKVFYKLYKEIDGSFPELTYELSGRIKALISALNKMDEIEEEVMNTIRLEFINHNFIIEKMTEEEKERYMAVLLEELNSERHNQTKAEFSDFFMGYDFNGKNPFSRIRDFFAFRIILEDDGKGDLIGELYEITNLMIEFFNKNTFEVKHSYPLRQTGKLDIDSHLIYIPEKSGLKEEYKNLVKDYVICPKKDGYQSIHFIVFDPYTERHFEVQVRTRSMDIIADTLANHDFYKMKRYGKQQQSVEEQIDFSRIHVKGFRYFKYTNPVDGSEKEYISDRAGIIRSIPIKLEFEHFLTM